MKKTIYLFPVLIAMALLLQGCATTQTQSTMSAKRYSKVSPEEKSAGRGSPDGSSLADIDALPQLIAPIPASVKLMADAVTAPKAETSAPTAKKDEKAAKAIQTATITRKTKQTATSEEPKPVEPTVIKQPVIENVPAPAEDPRAPSGHAYRLRTTDNIIVSLRGIPQPDQIEDNIDEGGFITLPYIDRIAALGKTCSELERDIRDAYLDGQIYKNVQVIVAVPTHSYYIRGEVKRPSRYPLDSETTMMKALATAGGYTEYANHKKIKVLRGDSVFYVNMKEIENDPKTDIDIQMGDVIVVERSVW